MADEDEGAVHIGGGSFRVERGRALQVLSRYQLAEPWMFLLPLVRCAVASGAGRVIVTPERGAVEVAFDGRPFARESLRDPYAPLFDEEGAEDRRGRELALGLLAALRLAPARVTVASAGARLTAEGLEGERVEDDPAAPPAGTVVRVASAHAALWGADRHALLERCCWTSPVPVRVDGVELTRLAAGYAPGRAFDEDGVRGLVTVPAQALDACALDACSLGVLAAKVRPALPVVQVDGCFDADDLRLDASQRGVVEDAAYARALAVVGRQAERLLADIIPRQRAMLAAVAKALGRPAALARWRERFEGKPPEAHAGLLSRLLGGAPPSAPPEAELDWCARTTAWLRRAAMRTPPAAAVWGAPLLLGTDGSPRSLANVAELRDRLGVIPLARKPGAGPEGVWLTTSRDVEVLTRHFPDALRMSD